MYVYVYNVNQARLNDLSFQQYKKKKLPNKKWIWLNSVTLSSNLSFLKKRRIWLFCVFMVSIRDVKFTIGCITYISKESGKNSILTQLSEYGIT